MALVLRQSPFDQSRLPYYTLGQLATEIWHSRLLFPPFWPLKVDVLPVDRVAKSYKLTELTEQGLTP